jgi:uncharacterized protein
MLDNRTMGKLLVLIVLVVIAFWLLKRALQRSSKEEPPKSKPVTGDLVACARCGVNLPREEARPVGAELYCSEEHAQMGRKDSSSGKP